MCFLGWWSIIQNKLQQRKKEREREKNKKLAYEHVWAQTQHHKGLFNSICDCGIHIFHYDKVLFHVRLLSSVCQEHLPFNKVYVNKAHV